MAELFHIADDAVDVLRPVSFRQDHKEDDLQRWVDANPHMVNEGTPMLSLGREIETHHGFAIDNLFIDGTGCLVVAELKRGLTPKEVIAQVVNYAAYVTSLEWPDVEAICQKHRRDDLDMSFRQCFGRALVMADKVDHRLLILAERYEPSVRDAALYLINTGTPLALLQFTYFEIGENRLFEVRTVLGEIPDQQVGGPDTRDTSSAADEGYNNWLFSSVAKELPEIARRRGWEMRHRVNKQSLPMVSEAWPTALGDCQLRLDTFKKGAVTLSLLARKEATPGLEEFLDGRRDEWGDAFPAQFAHPPYTIVFLNLSYHVPRPEIGDAEALADIVERTEKMLAVMLPLTTDYFEEAAHADEGRAGGSGGA